jgi:CsoR family transcriptional regulator, copper-sensing transcriptional repressor
MMDAGTKQKVRARLRRIAGQVAAIERMVDEDRYCVDVMNQVAAVHAALGKVGEVVMRQHVETCVTHAMRSGDAAVRKAKIDELMALYGRYGL